MTTVDPATGLMLSFVLRLSTIGLTWLARRYAVAPRLALIGSIVASAVTALCGVSALVSGTPSARTLFVHQASGMVLGCRIDTLSAWFLIVIASVAIPVALFSIGYIDRAALRHRGAFIGAAFSALVGVVELVFTAADVVTFLLAWELMALINAALVTTEHETAENRRAALLYLTMAHVGTGCLFAGFLLLSAWSGSLSFADVLSGTVATGPARHALFVLFLIGFGVKAGIVPLHVWLPEAHPAAPSPVSSLMSGVLIKTGIYGVVRVCVFGLGQPALAWGIVIVIIGSASAILGVLYALIQHDLKRLLAYHSIENIGIILLGLGAGMMGMASGHPGLALLGLSAGLFHILNHAMFKGLLFLSAGSAISAAGHRHLEALGGLLRSMPWTGVCFLVGAMAISGLPPLNGFASEWLTFQALLDGARGAEDNFLRFLFPIGGTLLALTTALAAACFVKAFGITFLARPRTPDAAGAREAPPIMLVPQIAMAGACVALGLFPGVAIHLVGQVLAPLTPVTPPAALASDAVTLTSGAGAFDGVRPVMLGLAIAVVMGVAALVTWLRVVRRAPTWGCGGQLTPRTEYTATAFSKPLLMIFRAVYRPTRQVDALARVSPYFTQEVRYRADVEPTFERYVYEPLTRTIFRIADALRALQAGSLQAYLAYVMVLVVTLVLFVWWRG